MAFWLQMAFIVSMFLDEILSVVYVARQTKIGGRPKIFAVIFHIVFIILIAWLAVEMLVGKTPVISAFFSALGLCLVVPNSLRTLNKLAR